MSSAWVNPAGGLRYHTRALLGARLWTPFRHALEAWLASFQPGAERVLLVGPSAAHCISDAFLSRFADITALEPDPFAGFLLRRRLARLGVRARVERRDRLIRPLLDGTSGLADLLRSDLRLPVVFCNVLGQTRFLLPDSEFSHFKTQFRAEIVPLLGSRAWLSFHDRLSGMLAPVFGAPFFAAARLSDAEVLSELYRAHALTLSAELFDHQSDGFFPEQQPHAYFTWQIDRQRYHLIEAVSAGARSGLKAE
jgi:hypothetical protein